MPNHNVPHRPRSTAREAPPYEDVDVIRNSMGMVAVITRAKKNQQLSAAIYKEFERDGKTERTSFFQRRHLDGLKELIALVTERLDELADIDRAAARMAESATRRS